MKPLSPQQCVVCEKVFTPKPGGYNAKYCSKGCKTRVRSSKVPREYKRRMSRETYKRIKADQMRADGRRAYDRKQRHVVRRWLADYKEARGCIDCGFRVHFAALQLDHQGPKSIPISQCRSSVTRLKEEIERGECVVRCANCHSIKTWADKNGVDYVKLREQLGLCPSIGAYLQEV